MAKKTWIMLKRGLSADPKHRENMGMAVWLYLHIIDSADWETGTVYGWHDAEAADEIAMNSRTVRDWRNKLEEGGYIKSIRRQHGLDIVIHNWNNPRDYSGKKINAKEEQPEQIDTTMSITENQIDTLIDTLIDTQIGSESVTPTFNSKIINHISTDSGARESVNQKANKTVDAILETERKAVGKEWTCLPEIYHPFARAFQESTGIRFTKRQSFDWMAEIDDWTASGFQPDDIRRAVADIQTEGRLTISRPGSITWKLRANTASKPAAKREAPLDPWEVMAISKELHKDDSLPEKPAVRYVPNPNSRNPLKREAAAHGN